MQCPPIISNSADVPCQRQLPSSNLFNHLCDVCFCVPVCFPSIPLSSTCSSSDPDFHFHPLIPVAFVVVRVVY